MTNKPSPFMPSQINALAAYYSRLESYTKHRHANPDLKVPDQPPEVASLLRTLTREQVPALAEQIALLNTRSPAVISAMIHNMLEWHKTAATADQVAPPAPAAPAGQRAPDIQMIPLGAAARIVAVLADRLVTWAGTDPDSMTEDDRQALKLAESLGWSPHAHRTPGTE